MRRLITNDYQPRFHALGVPYSVLHAPYPDALDKRFSNLEIPKKDGTSFVYDKARQKKALTAFRKTLTTDKTQAGRLLIASARDLDHLPGQLALALCAFAYQNGHAFLWHNVYGGFKDSLRDTPDAVTRFSNLSLLVIGNLADNATPIKVEKARDLLTQFSHAHRIVVTAGLSPFEYAKTHLRMRAAHYIWF